MRKAIHDASLGFAGEQAQKAPIEKYLGCSLKFSNSRWATFDFYNDNTFVEIKSRRINHDCYPDLMIGQNKVDEGKRQIALGKEVYFFYNLQDGLFFYKLRGDSDLRLGMGGRRDRGKDERKMVYYIPCSQLQKADMGDSASP